MLPKKQKSGLLNRKEGARKPVSGSLPPPFLACYETTSRGARGPSPVVVCSGPELKVQAGHASGPVFQQLPIYFGKQAGVCRTGLQAAVGWKLENAPHCLCEVIHHFKRPRTGPSSRQPATRRFLTGEVHSLWARLTRATELVTPDVATVGAPRLS